MFTGFASENTPAIQVWDFFRTFASTSAVRSVSLPDDCAPIQVFRTGATGSSFIRVFLPTAPIEGKQITIVNQHYGVNTQSIDICSSDVNGGGTANPILTCGPSSSIVFVYSKQAISFGTNSGVFASGWIALNQSSTGSVAYGSAIVGGDSNKITNSNSFIGGGQSNLASGTFSSIVGGQSNTASGNSSAVVGGSNATASGNNAIVLGATSSSATNTQSIVVGGESNTSSAFRGAVIAGQQNNASGENAITLGGINVLANSTNSSVLGGYGGTTRSISGYTVLPACSQTIASGRGFSQTATLVVARQTTDATSIRLNSNGAATGQTTNQVILPNNSAYTFQGTCIANVTGGGDTSGWKFEGVIKRGANAASTTLVAAVTPTVIAQDAGASAWVLAITADTTNGGIAVTVTGQAATTIRWVAKIETTEVTF